MWCLLLLSNQKLWQSLIGEDKGCVLNMPVWRKSGGEERGENVEERKDRRWERGEGEDLNCQWENLKVFVFISFSFSMWGMNN